VPNDERLETRVKNLEIAHLTIPLALLRPFEPRTRSEEEWRC
jgi:hypothetical protein